MDGQEYSFIVNSRNPWTATFSDPSSMLASATTPVTGGSSNNYEFKFKLKAITSSNKQASIKFVDSMGNETTVTINGIVPTLFVDISGWQPRVDGESTPYHVSSNSSLPIQVSFGGASSWLRAENGLLIAKENTVKTTQSATVTISNGISSLNRTISVNQPALTFSSTFSAIGFYPDISWNNNNPLTIPLFVNTNTQTRSIWYNTNGASWFWYNGQWIGANTNTTPDNRSSNLDICITNSDGTITTLGRIPVLQWGVPKLTVTPNTSLGYVHPVGNTGGTLPHMIGCNQGAYGVGWTCQIRSATDWTNISLRPIAYGIYIDIKATTKTSGNTYVIRFETINDGSTGRPYIFYDLEIKQRGSSSLGGRGN